MTEENKASTKTVLLKGKIFSGSGEAARFTALPWVKRQIKEKLGFTPYLGTLNLKLTGEYAGVRKLLENLEAIEILPEPGYCSGKIFRAHIENDVSCAVVLPCVKNYPEDILEIIAPLNLREKLKLKDGDEVKVEISFE
ncbi:CTP-dependent riboflavin kinase [Candidatus Bathyarchaeota archaeon]|nr:CTP-dependent riboflavin kinase [Candidatus Bathyarchaeota archaeon]